MKHQPIRLHPLACRCAICRPVDPDARWHPAIGALAGVAAVCAVDLLTGAHALRALIGL